MTNPAGNTVAMVNAFTGHAPMDARLDILGNCARTFVILRVFPISVTPHLAYVQRAVRSAGRVCSVKVNYYKSTHVQASTFNTSVFLEHKCLLSIFFLFSGT